MLARNLEFSPAADELPMVAQVLVEDLQAWNYSDADCDRVSDGINTAGRSTRRWPTNHDIRAAIKKRSEWEPEQRALPSTKKEKVARMRVAEHHLNNIRKILNKKNQSDRDQIKKKEKFNERHAKYMSSHLGTMADDLEIKMRKEEHKRLDEKLGTT